MNEQQKRAREGVITAVLAYTMWGFMPVYLILVKTVPATEMLLHRIIWSVPFGALIIAMRGQWGEVGRALRSRKMIGWLALAAFFIALNWLVYIFAVQRQQIFQASLGYYINPLLYVLVGVLFFSEVLRRAQLFAVVLASAGVLVLTFSGGEFPWISLVLAASFTVYGVIRRQVEIGGMPGLFIETLLLLPVAMIGFGWLVNESASVFMDSDWPFRWLVILSGPITVLPLLCFALAARRLHLTTIGFLQYIGPSLQFMIGWLNGEVLSSARLVCFLLIWTAVIVFCADSLRRRS
ncbi:MAG: EamA family transporter RarD [Pseudomonadota bacterium]